MQSSIIGDNILNDIVFNPTNKSWTHPSGWASVVVNHALHRATLIKMFGLQCGVDELDSAGVAVSDQTVDFS